MIEKLSVVLGLGTVIVLVLLSWISKLPSVTMFAVAICSSTY